MKNETDKLDEQLGGELSAGSNSFEPSEQINYPFVVFRHLDRILVLKSSTIMSRSADWRTLERYREAVKGLYLLLYPNRLLMNEKDQPKMSRLYDELTTNKGRPLVTATQPEIVQKKTDALLEELLKYNSGLFVRRKRLNNMV